MSPKAKKIAIGAGVVVVLAGGGIAAYMLTRPPAQPALPPPPAPRPDVNPLLAAGVTLPQQWLATRAKDPRTGKPYRIPNRRAA